MRESAHVPVDASLISSVNPLPTPPHDVTIPQARLRAREEATFLAEWHRRWDARDR